MKIKVSGGAGQITDHFLFQGSIIFNIFVSYSFNQVPKRIDFLCQHPLLDTYIQEI